jgi:drug/metabolite transporter (DMT)-like permease
MTDLSTARAQHHTRSIRWGFAWALWCAILWGAWYVPGTAIWYERPYVNMNVDHTGTFLMAAAVITAFNAVAVLIWLVVWTGVLGKWAEFFRTLRQLRFISKWYFLGAILGGPIAIFGSFIAIGYIGPVFAAIAALMYPIVGAIAAKLWYAEKITARAALGILIIIAGGVAVYAPGIFSELSGTGTGRWLGYVGGLMAAVGWGLEGAIAGRALDVTDPDVGLPVRFFAETLYWVLLIVPAIALFTNLPVGDVIVQTFNPWAIVWLLLAGLTFGFCYVSWYKAFPLIGVGRGQAFAALYGVFAVMFLAVFAGQIPGWNFVLGLVLTVIGGFVMYTERSEVLEVLRAVRTHREPQAEVKSTTQQLGI